MGGAATTGQTASELRAELEQQLGRELSRTEQLAALTDGLLDAVFDHSPHGLLVCDRTGRILVMNQAAERIWAGRARADELAQWGRYRAFHPDGRPYAAEDWAMARCLAAGEVVSAEEVHFQRFDDTHGILLGSCAPIRDAEGAITGALSVFADISEFKRAEAAERAARHEAEQLLALAEALTLAPDEEATFEAALAALRTALGVDRAAILLLDEHHVMRFRAWTGLSEAYRAAVEGHSPWAPDVSGPAPVIVDDAHAAPDLAAYGDLFEAEGIRSLAFIPLTSAGQLIGKFMVYGREPHAFTPHHLRLARAIAGHVARAVARARADEALRASEARYRRLFEDAADGILATSPAGTILAANPSAGALLGVPPAALIGASIAALTHPDDRALRDAILPPLARGEVITQRRRLRHADGRYVLVEGVARIQDDGTLLTFLRDVSAQAAADAALREASRKKDEFLAMLSHELRNPLAAIRSSLDLVALAPAGSGVLERARDIVERQTTHLTRMVDDLLDVTRIERGKVELQRARVDLGEVVRRTVEDHRPALDAAGLVTTLEIDGAPLPADADATRVAQIVGNLLVNAAKFTPTGGRVTIALARDGADARLEVRDTGVGFAPEHAEHLLQPFTQLGASLDRGRGGLGLGLALVKGLVELHGGSVVAASPGPGHGSAFTLRLPLAAAAPVPARPRVRAASAPRRILVIDDNRDAADMLAEVLALDGHAVACAYAGEEGLAQARALAPDVVLCDIGLPGADGYAVARALRLDAATRGAYLVALTGYTQPDDLARATAAGFDAHVPKPANARAIRALLAAQAPAQPAT